MLRNILIGKAKIPDKIIFVIQNIHFFLLVNSYKRSNKKEIKIMTK